MHTNRSDSVRGWQFYGVIKVTAVYCATQKKICDEYGVKEFPTLKVIPPGGFGTQDYTGERNEKAVYSWALKFFSHFVEKVGGTQPCLVRKP